jgi:hypothetical protein
MLTIDEARKQGKLTWCGELTGCDICQQPFGEYMYDAKWPTGPYGNICRSCFKRGNWQLGVDRGQEYRLAEDGKFYLVAGGEGQSQESTYRKS